MTVTQDAATAARRDPLDPERIRADFPILSTTSHGRPLVFLDSASTSQKPRAVIDAFDAYYNEYAANVHRGIYEIGERATSAGTGSRSAPAGASGTRRASSGTSGERPASRRIGP